MESMEERVSGFRIRGSWTDIVELGERITQALIDAGISDEALDEWETWRPKAHERLDEEMRLKTSEQASVDEGPGERSDVTAGEDIRTAGKKIREASGRLRDEAPGGALASLQDSVDHAKRAADTTGRQALRSIEDAVYRNLMTEVAPQYFDNELISANIRRTSQLDTDDEFVFEININDDDLKDEISDILATYQDEIDRWHVDVQKDISNLASAENVEVSG
ncbi:MAG: DUF5828 family protein [Halobacteriales archaeon]|nr:DUF5828 family protein [Halobacteriales archaeon]